MASESASVLIVEDSMSLGSVYRAYLRDEPYAVSHVPDGAGAMARIERDPPDAMLLDLQLPDMDGMDILKHIHERGVPVAVVIITGHGSVDKAVDAMRYGAFDFVEKPVAQKRLIVTLRNAVEKVRMRDFVDRLTDDFRREGYHGFVGSSLPMQAVYRIIDSAAPSKATVFITGESGSGKEVCAEAIHHRSDRRERPCIAINCAAIPRDLMESEIFGHIKGAFTGAVRDRVGAAKQADGGTLFWTRSRRWTWTCRRSCCGSSRPAVFSPWAARPSSGWTCASSAPPIAIRSPRWPPGVFARTCSTACT